MSLSDLNSAARTVEAITKVATDAIEKVYPRPRYAEVLEIFTTTREVRVSYPDEVGDFRVPCGAYLPLAVGQIVRIFGPAGGRYVDEVLGAASFDGTIGENAETFVVASQAAMLATGAQRGDFAIRTDQTKTYVLRVTPATVLGNWQEFLDPGAEAVAMNVLANHTAASDPHPGYLTQTEADLLYSGASSISAAITAHVALTDPHSQYLQLTGGDTIQPSVNSLIGVTVRGHATQVANLQEWVDGGGVTRVWVTAAGALSGVGSGLTSLNASNVSSGTLDAARLPASVWTSANDGATSGLDADLLDGQHGSYYLASTSYTAADVLAKLITVDGTGSLLDADFLDGQSGAYYLDWANVTSKPDPVVTVTLTGDVTGTANATLTDLASGTVSVATTIAANAVALGTDTAGNYVATIAGTTNQVSVANSGTETAAVVLSLPQDIHSGASPTFVRPTFSQATGSSPFVVSSTTKVTNLNADLLDGNESTAFAQSAVVESLLGDLLFVGLYDPTTYVIGNTATLPAPNWDLGTAIYRHAMYWVVASSAEVDFIDSDLSGRNTSTDVPVNLKNGDWIVTVDPALGTNGPGVNLTQAQVTFQYIPFSSENFVRSLLDEHATNPTDPHSAAGYLTAITGADIFAPILHEHDADIGAAIEIHEAALDPHPVYLSQDEATILYADITHLHPGVYEPVGLVAAHEAKSDPHAQYMLQSETDALYSLKTHLHDERYALISQIPVVPKRIRSTDASGENNIWIGSVTPVTNFSAELKVGDLWYETFNLALVAPAAPANFTGTATIGTTVSLSWSAYATDIAQTEIQVDRENTVGSGTWTNILTDAAAPYLTTFDDTGRLERTQYSYRIRGRNATGYGPYSTLLITTANDAPAAPTGVSASVLSSTSLRLSWTASTALDLHATQAYEMMLNGSVIAYATISPYDFTGLTENTLYTLGIRAKDTLNVISSTVTATATTSNGTPPPPTSLTTSAGSYDRVTLSWTAPTGVTDVSSYEIYRNGALLTTISALTYTYTGLAELTLYTLGVKSKDTGALTSSLATTTYTTSANPDTTPPNNPTVTSLIPESTYGAIRFRGTWAATTAFATVQSSTNNSNWTTEVARTAVTAGATFNYAIGTYSAGQTCYVRTIVEDSAGNSRTSGSTSYTLVASPTVVYADATNQWRNTNGGQYGGTGNQNPYTGYYSDAALNAKGYWYYGTKPATQLYYSGRRTITGLRFLQVRGTAGGSTASAPTIFMHNVTSNPGNVTGTAAHTLYETGQTGASVTTPAGAPADVAWTDLGATWGGYLVDGVHRGIAIYDADGTPYQKYLTVSENSFSGALEFTHLG